MEASDAADHAEQVLRAVSEVVIADEEFLKTVMTGILAKGHVLIEDVPGTGKTLTARSVAGALGLSFRRIQFTPDLLPGDITGSHIYNEQTQEFEFNEGPIFANVVLADEINRAPPKTQAALLEAMGEKQVSTDEGTVQLPEPFFVIATQNPIEQEGTFRLPEAQRDRFMVKTRMGYPDAAGERELLDRRAERTSQIPSISQVTDGDEVAQMQAVAETVTVDGKLRDYMVALGRETRTDGRVDIGVSPRGIQRLFEASRARALVNGREYVAPDDIKEVIHPTFDHRIVLTSEARIQNTTGEQVVDAVISSVDVPVMDELSDRTD